jgi:hypothetical protein
MAGKRVLSEGATGMAKLFGIKIAGYEPNPPQ